MNALEVSGAARLVGRRIAGLGMHAVRTVGTARWHTLGAGEGPRLRTLARLLHEVVGHICAVHGLQPRVTGPVPRGPVVLVANHLSYLDPLVVGAVAPCAPISKAEVADWPIIGPTASSIGVLFVRRESLASRVRVLRRAIRALHHGVSVLNFPEGTTTNGRSILPFRRGVFGAARLAGMPIVPVAIAYESPSLAWVGDEDFLPHYLRTAARLRTAVHVAFGSPIRPGRTASDDAGVAAAARASIEQLLKGA